MPRLIEIWFSSSYGEEDLSMHFLFCYYPPWIERDKSQTTYEKIYHSSWFTCNSASLYRFCVLEYTCTFLSLKLLFE